MSTRNEQAFLTATPRSRALWEQASRVYPDGVSGQAKHYDPYPVFLDAAHGSRVVDVDGRELVDLLMGAGPMLLGHGDPHVLAAITAQASRMINPMSPHRAGLAFAERLQSLMPHLERLRFANTGSEATRSAVRVARAATGKTLVAKFEGNFHGSDDAFLVSTHTRRLAGAADRPEPVLDYAGVPERILAETIVLPYNDGPAAATLIAEHADLLAAVIMEPVSFSSGGGIPATVEFAEAIRAVTAEHGIVLIFDEVLCSLRLGLHGAPAYLGVVPDLVTLGKAIGGGLPLAAFGGRADLMEAALGADAGARKIFQSGTFTENPLSIAAGSATLDVLETTDALERANTAAEAIRQGMREILSASGTVAAVTGVGSIIQVHVGIESAHNRRDVVASDIAATADLLLGCVAEGVLWPPVHPALTSAAHDQADVDRILDAVKTSVDRLEA